MAPNGHAPNSSSDVNGQSQNEISKPWYDKNGREEYRAWQKAHPLNHIAYEKWKTSKYVDGISLYYATLGIFEESDSTDDELEQSDSKRRARNVLGSAAREPKTLTNSNGLGSSRKNGSATPLSADQNEQETSGKKKRKPRKKPKSSEVIASEVDSEEVETAATPSASAITASGNRKSSNRKPRKKPLSEEIISPEDEEDDPMSIDNTAPMAIASPLPVRSAPNSAKTSKVVEPPKKHILKLYTKKTPKKKALSEETVRDDTDDEKPNAAAVPSSTTTTAMNADSDRDITAALERHLNADVDSNASPAPDSESRKGLRARRPAQQKPYSLDALAYDVPGDQNDFSDIQAMSPAGRSRRTSVVSIPQMYEEPPLQMLDEEALAILRGGLDPGPEHEMERRRSTKPKHFKGKGRAWKKDESDEDMEFNPSKKKAAAKAKEKVPKPPPPGKKRGRPRKSTTVLPEDVIQEGSDSDAASKVDDSSLMETPSVPIATTLVRKPRRVARKSALSEELVRDDSDEEDQEQQQDTIVEEDAPMAEAPIARLAEVATTPAKKRGRPRKSDQSTASNTITETPKVQTQAQKEVSPAPIPKVTSTPSTTSEDTPLESSPMIVVEQATAKQSSPTENSAVIEGVIAKPVTVEEVKTEPKKASVETDDDEELCESPVLDGQNAS